MNEFEKPLVDFLTAGAQKCGTTILHGLLSQHSGVVAAEPKELHYFEKEKNFEGLDPLDGYRGYHEKFPEKPEGVLAFESTPSYFYFPAAIARIHRYQPAMKIVVILRDPLERAFSHYQMRRRMEREPAETFEAALDAEDVRLFSRGRARHGASAYVGRGMYAQQLLHLYRYFPKEQVFVGLFDDFRDDSQSFVRRVCEFLELDEAPPVGDVWQERPTSGVSAETKGRFREIFREEREALQFLISRDLSHWMSE